MLTEECALASGEVSVGCTLLERVTVIFLTPAGAPKVSCLHRQTVGPLREASSHRRGLINMPTRPAGITELPRPGVPLQPTEVRLTFCSRPLAAMGCDRKVNKANVVLGRGQLM